MRVAEQGIIELQSFVDTPSSFRPEPVPHRQ